MARCAPRSNFRFSRAHPAGNCPCAPRRRTARLSSSPREIHAAAGRSSAGIPLLRIQGHWQRREPDHRPADPGVGLSIAHRPHPKSRRKLRRFERLRVRRQQGIYRGPAGAALRRGVQGGPRLQEGNHPDRGDGLWHSLEADHQIHASAQVRSLARMGIRQDQALGASQARGAARRRRVLQIYPEIHARARCLDPAGDAGSRRQSLREHGSAVQFPARGVRECGQGEAGRRVVGWCRAGERRGQRDVRRRQAEAHRRFEDL